jgi:hypothetical protein
LLIPRTLAAAPRLIRSSPSASGVEDMLEAPLHRLGVA